MISKIYYSIVAFLIIATLVACELFESGYGDKVDLSEPIVTIDSPVNGEYVNGSFILKGTATDDTSIKEVKIDFTSNVSGEATSLTASITDSNWFIEIDTSDNNIFNDGETEFTVTAIDSADKQTSKNRMVYSDNTIPTVLVSSPSSQDMEIVNGVLDIRGSVLDLRIDKVEVFVVSVANPEVKFGGIAEGTSSWKYEFDTIAANIGVTNVESFYLEVTAYDVAGNQNSYFYFNDDLSSVKDSLGVSRITIEHLADKNNITQLLNIQRSSNSSTRLVMNIDQNADTPKIILPEWDLTAPENYKSFTSDVFLSGRLTDDDGIDSIVLSIYKESNNINRGDEVSLVREGTAYPMGSRSYNLDIPLEDVNWSGYTMTSGLSEEYLSEGLYYYTITVKDIEGSDSGTASLLNSAHFGIDKTYPVINVLTPTQDQFFNNDFSITGSATDEVNIRSIKIYMDGVLIDNSNSSDSNIVLTDITNGKNWSYDFDTTGITGRIALKAEVTDGSGKNTNETVTVSVDSVAPVLNITNLTDGQLITDTDSYTITGTAIDESGIKEIYYSLDGGTWTLFDNPSASWEYNLVGLVDSLTKSFSIKAIDNAGNESSPLTLNYSIDLALPLTTIVGLDGFESSLKYYNSNIYLNGIASDNNGIKSVVITSVDSSGYIHSLLDTTSKDWSINNLSLDDDVYELNILITDNADRVKKYSGRVGIDKSAPELIISSPQDQESTSINIYTLKGTSRDFGKGFDETRDVEYSYDNGVSWYPILLKSNSEWEKDYDFGDNEGSAVFTFRSTDYLSNIVESSNITLFYDKSAPTFTEVSIPNENNIYISNNVTFTGEVYDSHGIESVKVSINGGMSWSADFKPETGSTWEYQLDIDGDESGKDYDLLFRVIDVAGKKNDIQRRVTVETAAPEVSIDNITGYVSGLIPIQGTASDEDNGSGLSKVEFKLDGDVWSSTTINTEGDGYRWSGLLDLEDVNEGDNVLYVRSVDYAGNYSDAVTITIKVDKLGPTATITNSDGIESNNNITFSGTASDNIGIASTQLIWSLNGGGETVIPLTLTDDAWTYTLETSNGNGQYELQLEVTDVSGKVTKYPSSTTLKALVDNLAPVLTVSSPVDGESTSVRNFTISGSSNDAGVKFDTTDDVEYSLDGGVWTELTLSGTTWSEVIDLGASEGSFTLDFRSTDKLGNIVTLPSRTLYFDNSAPTLTVVEANGIITNVDQDYTGIASDTNELSKLEVSVGGGAYSGITVETDNSWSYSFDSDVDSSSDKTVGDNGTYNLTFKATDIAGKETTDSKDITIDVTIPTATVDAVSGYVKGVIGISGNSFDIGTGINTVEYQLGGTDEGSWTEASGSLPWTDSIDLASATLGDNVLNVRSKDYAGNTSAIASTTIKVDKLAPVATITNSDALESNSNITFTGTASDDLTLDNAKLFWSLNGGGETSVPLTLIGNAWSYTLITSNGNGLYEVRLEATDIAGKVTTVAQTATIDTLAPVLTVSSPVDGESTSVQNFTISGSSSDAGVKFDGTDDIEYRLDSGAWTALALTGTSWSETLDLGASEGAFILEFRSTDKLGNIVTLPSRSLYFDNAAPTLTVVEANGIITNVDQVYTGIASDTNELSKLEISVDGGVFTGIIVNGDDTWAYSFDSDADGSLGNTVGDNGTYNLTFKATDIAGKETTDSKDITIDVSAPTATVDAVSGYVKGVIGISGNSFDIGTGIKTVEYQLGGVASGFWTEASGSLPWTDSIDLASATLGDNVLNVRSKDYAGNTSAIASTTIKIDKLAPVATITNADALESNSNITFTGTASDDLTLDNAKLFWSLNGGGETTVPLTLIGNAWSYTLNTSTGNGLYEVRLEATDIAGKVTTVTQTATIDTLAPVISVETPTDKAAVNDATLPLRVNVSDLTGVGFDATKKVLYQLDGFAGTWLPMTIDINGKWNANVNLGSGEKEYNIYFKAEDTLGNIIDAASTKHTVYLDSAAPVLTEGTINSVDTKFIKSALTITGTASDSNELAKLELYIDGIKEAGVITVNATTHIWTYDIDPGAQGNKTYKFVATDIAGKSTEIVRNVTLDTGLPILVLSTLIPTYNYGLTTIEGTVEDIYGIDSVVVKKQDGSDELASLTWDSGNSRYNWKVVLDLQTEGDFILDITALDNADNSTGNSSETIHVDQSYPTLTEINIPDSNNIFIKEDKVLGGSISDTNGLSKLELSVDGGAFSEIIIDFDGVDNIYGTDDDITAWSYSFDSDVDGSLSETPGDNGEYDLIFRATDIVNKVSTVARTITVDVSDPTVYVNNISGSSVYGLLNISGTILDPNADFVTYQLDSGDVLTAVLIEDSPGNFSWSGTVNAIIEGDSVVNVIGYDKSNNSNINTTSTFKVDYANPTSTVVGISETFSYLNTGISISGEASDANGISSVVVRSSLDGAAFTILPSAGTSSWSVIDPLNIEGVYEVEVIITDNASKETTYTRRVGIDKSTPILTVSSPSTNENVTSGSYTIRGTVSDESGKGVTELQYSRTGLVSSWTDITLSGLNWSVTGVDFTSPIGSETSEGARTLYLRTSDGLNSDATETIVFYRDTTAPSIDETAINTVTQEFRNIDFSLSGNADDTVSFKEVRISATKNGQLQDLDLGSASNDVVFSSSPYSYDVTLQSDGSEDGEWVYTLTAYDNAGNSNSIVRKIYIDETLPVAPSVTSSIPRSVEDTLSLEGSATDLSSGISLVQWSLDGSTNWTSFTGTDNWYGNSTVSSVIEGPKILYLRSLDRAGNVSTSSNIGYVIDNANPILTVDTYNDYATDDFTITGTVTDTLDLGTTPISISVTRNGSNVTSGSLIYTNESSTSKDWSQVIPASVTDGIYIITVSATDDGGRFVNSSKTVIVESDIPSISGLNVSNEDTIGTESFTIIGSASDSSGIKLVEYSLDFTDDSVENDTWIAVDGGTETWNAKLTGLTDVIGKVVSFRATDNANNIMTGGDVVSISFNVDLNAPVIGDVIADRLTPFDFAVDSNTTIVTTNQAYGGSSKDFALKILAKDTIGIATISVNIPGNGNISATDTTKVEGEYEVWTTNTISIGTLPDGTSDWVVTVTDSSGLTSTLNKTILLDNTVPIITHLSPRSLSDIVNGEIEVKGLANDAGSGLNTVEYKVGYSPENEIWQSVGGSNFNWEIPFTGLNKIDIYAGLEVDSVTTGIITKANHGYIEATPLWIGADNMPVGLNASTTYYAVDVTSNTFELSSSASNNDKISFVTDNDTVLRVSKYGQDLENDSYWQVPVLIKATDDAGNIYEETTTSYIVKVDPSGDKPNMSIVYPDPDATNRVMGGIIRIFGTAEDDDAVDSVYMQIDTNSDGDFTSLDDAIGTWFNGGEGQVVDGTASWNKSINTNGELNPQVMNAIDIVAGESYRIVSAGTTNYITLGSDNNDVDTEFTATADGTGTGTVEPLTKTIRFRIRAKDINDVYGPWSTTQLIEIDKNVPKIGSSIVTTLKHSEDAGTVQNYVSDMWIKDNWILEGSIEDETGISEITITGSISGTLADNSEWFTVFDSGNGTTGYTMSIPIETLSNDSDNISFTVTALDNNDPKMSSSATFSINYDNEAPTLTSFTGTTPVVQSNKTYELSSTVNEDGSGLERVAYYFLRQGNNNAEDRVYNPMETSTGNVNRTYVNANLVMVDALPRLAITSGTRPSVYSITDSLLVGNLNVRKGGLIKIGGLDRLITAFDSASGTVSWADEIDISVTSAWIAYALIVDNADKIETPVWNGSVLESITNDDGDGVIEAIERAGGSYYWSSAIDSHNIPDGPIEIHWVSYDKSGNYASSYVSTQVLNNRPRLSKVTLGTDLSGNGTVEVGEQIPAYALFIDGEEEGEAEVTIADDADLFIARGLTTLDIEIVGGNGDLKYELYTPGADNTFGTVDVPSGDDVKLHNLTALRTGDDTNAVSTINLSGNVGDSNTDLMKLTDDARNNIMFRIWDSTEETTIGVNSQWAELKLPIYVDIVDGVKPMAVISPFFWNSESDNSLYDNSRENGHIEITGVYDGPDPDVSGQISVRGTAYDDQRIEELYIRIDGMNMTGTENDTFNSDVYQLVATYNKANNTWAGTDKWSAEGWLFTATNVSIDQDGHQVEWQLNWDTSKVLGVASLERNIRLVTLDKGNNVNIFTATASGDIKTYNEPEYTVDVVPYISSISTNTTGVKDLNIRTMLGNYSIKTGTTDNYITVNGFNLNVDTARMNKIVSNWSTGGTTMNITTIAASPWNKVLLRNNTDRSGYLTLITATNIPTINNINNNITYNIESDAVSNNSTWTDNRYFSVFDTKDTAILDGFYPNMIMEGDDPVFGYVDLSASNDLQMRRWNYNGGSATDIPLIRGLGFDQMAMAVDDDGRYSHISTHNFSGGNMTLIYDTYASDYTSNYGAASPYWSWYNGNRYTTGSNDALVMDSLNYSPGSKIGRFINPRLIAKGESNSANKHAKMFMTFYDSWSDEIIFRSLQIGRSVDGTANNMNNNQETNYSENPGTSNDLTRKVVVASGSGANQFYDLGMTSDNRAIILYYDKLNSVLKMKYSSTILDASSTTASISWIDSTIPFPEYVGEYVKLFVHSDNSIHIAAQDSLDGDLVYMKIDSYDSSTFNQYLVESYKNVGSWADIKVSSSDVPYIAYYNKSDAGSKDTVKVAWLASVTNGDGVDNNGLVTGLWETVTVPANDSPQGDKKEFLRVNLGFSTDNSPVIGYLADDIEWSKYLPEIND